MSNATAATLGGQAAVRVEDARQGRLHRLVLEHHAFVWRCLRRFGVPAGDADDAAQHVFLVAAKKLDQIPAEQEKTFLFGTAVRVASNARRSSVRMHETPWMEVPEVPSHAPLPDEQLSQAERQRVLDEILARLPLEVRDVFVLAELEHWSAPDIARAVSIPVGTVASRLRRARELFAGEVRRLQARTGTTREKRP